MIRLAVLALLAAFQPAFPEAAAAAEECRLGLALGLDVSSSVDDAEYALQKNGLAAAFRHPDIRDALLGQDGVVDVLIYEWSGYYQQDLIADWTPLASPAAIAALAARLEAHRRTYSVYPTAVGRGVEFGARQFPRLSSPCARRVIDISGDGVNNLSVDPEYYRQLGKLDAVVINALVIKGAVPDPEEYYRAQVISGPGSFLMVANGFEDYPELIREKLLREIAPPVVVGALP
jgi:hypothetical protein